MRRFLLNDLISLPNVFTYHFSVCPSQLAWNCGFISEVYTQCTYVDTSVICVIITE